MAAMKFCGLVGGRGGWASGGGPEILGLEYNPRRIQPGWLFVAMQGESTDGNRYIDAALKNGAVAVVTDSQHEQRRRGMPWVVVPHGRRALARLSANFYGGPAGQLPMVVITRTNGKTTSNILSDSILQTDVKK